MSRSRGPASRRAGSAEPDEAGDDGQHEDDEDRADEREAVTVSAATDSYESVYGADDLDVPDFLK